MKSSFCVNAGALCFALILSLGLLFPGTVSADPKGDYEKGYDLYERKSDVASAIVYLKKSADAGYAPAQALLGYIYDQSEFDEEAVEMYRRAAEQGNAAGEFGLGQMYAKGEGIKKDYKKAIELITKAAEKGNLSAAKMLAAIYKTGDFGVTPDPSRAAFWASEVKAIEKEIAEKEKKEAAKAEKKKKGEEAAKSGKK